jgi:hypothetical protein
MNCIFVLEKAMGNMSKPMGNLQIYCSNFGEVTGKDAGHIPTCVALF